MNAVAVPEVFLHTGQFYFGGGRTRVRTLLGTCVAIVVWHPNLRIGGMCHYLLPTRGGARPATQNEGMYADEVMELFARELKTTGTRAEEYVVKLFGGGHMFPDHRRGDECQVDPCTPTHRTKCHDVGCKNVKTGRELLDVRGYRISVEHVGGVGSRDLVFDVWSGDVWMRHSTQTIPRSMSAK